MSNKPIIYLLGYQSNHTHTYPQSRFFEVFNFLGFETRWVDKSQIQPSNGRRIFVCWDQPNAKYLVDNNIYTSGDVILQKVTALVPSYGNPPNLNWGDTKESATEFLKNLNWPAYQMITDLLGQGINIYGFGCNTFYKDFPHKNKLVTDLLSQDRLFYHPWGPCLYDKAELDAAKPIINDFDYDIGYVGSIWGVTGRGNVDTIGKFLNPLVQGKSCAIGGLGTPLGPVNDNSHKNILKKSKLCPIVNALVWNMEGGVQDRFWTVFASGRFGVVDNEGVYEFFDKDEVVCATEPEEYIELSQYYLDHPEKQLPFIENILSRIQKEYNWYNTWSTILKSVV